MQDIFFLKQKYIFSYSWLEKYFFKISKNSIASAFFLLRQILKNIDVPHPWHLRNVEVNFVTVERMGFTSKINISL